MAAFYVPPVINHTFRWDYRPLSCVEIYIPVDMGFGIVCERLFGNLIQIGKYAAGNKGFSIGEEV